MRRKLLLVIGLVVAGGAQAIAAQPVISESSWFTGGVRPSAELEQPPFASATVASVQASPSGTHWSAAPKGARFGSGLEDDDPARPLSVFYQSGLDSPISSKSARLGAARFGSGLEEGAPVRPVSVFLQSGLEGRASKSARSGAARFGSGLEDGLPVKRTKTSRQAGF